MKRFIKSVILFPFYLFIFYIMLTVIAGRFMPSMFKGNILTENKIAARDGSQKRYAEIKESNFDIIVLGSSHAYRGYDSGFFQNYGYKMYNLGSSAQTLRLTEFIYNNYVGILKPKKIIIDIYPVLFGNEGGESELNLLPMFYNKNAFVKDAISNFDIRVINSLIYFQIFGNTKKIKSTLSKDDQYVKGGYISTNKVNKKFTRYKNEALTINEKNIKALKSIISDAKSKGIEVYLFQAPLPEARYKSFTNNKEIDSLMNSLGKYYNYNEEKFLTNDCFSDDSHINQKGVNIYNKWVLEKINEK
ncbi:hypothetical protein J2X97_002492 [Epilithonimonas hungarica]|uniref:hypothetical protein n=1 Tax=Epilithonimonas hungarica TaxID=454006 RepID=UPI0027872B67|nr:hypothetical protein [Epilithonimonas hungarica]MDP9956833.1 hypothetical protein [Epilithonimonas hungarica]